MNRDQKAVAIAEIAAKIDESEAIFAVDYRGISVPEAAELRAKLRESDATFKVVKNSLTERAACHLKACIAQLLFGIRPSAASTTEGVIGSSCSRTPVALNTALAMAGAVAILAGSAIP